MVNVTVEGNYHSKSKNMVTELSLNEIQLSIIENKYLQKHLQTTIMSSVNERDERLQKVIV